MQPFKVLNLPSVALIEVWKCLSPIELFGISQCSKRCYETVVLAGTRKFKLKLVFYPFHVSINNTWKFFVQKLNTWNMELEENTFPTSFEPDEIRFFSKNRETSFLTIFLHLIDLFKCPVHSVDAYLNTPHDIYMSSIKSVCSRQKAIANLDIMTGSDEDVNFILYNLKVYESLCIGTDKLSVNYALPYQISCKYVHIFHSSFITLDDVLSMKETVDIQIERSSFTNQDLEVLFQHWISGKLPKLEFLMISGVKLTGEMKIGDLETLWGPNAVFVEKQICGKYRRIHAPVPLQRNDGVVGNVNFRNSDDHDYPASIRLLV